MPLTETMPPVEEAVVTEDMLLRAKARDLVERLAGKGLSEAVVILQAIVDYEEASHPPEEVRGEFVPCRRLPPVIRKCRDYSDYDPFAP